MWAILRRGVGVTTMGKRQKKAPYVAFGVRMKALREAMGKEWTQEAVAAQVHCSYSAYQSYEAGDRFPGPETLGALARFYHVATDYLLGVDPDAKSRIHAGSVGETEHSPQEIDREGLIPTIPGARGEGGGATDPPSDDAYWRRVAMDLIAAHKDRAPIEAAEARARELDAQARADDAAARKLTAENMNIALKRAGMSSDDLKAAVGGENDPRPVGGSDQK